MAKQTNATPMNASKPAASSSGGPGARPQTRKISNEKMGGKHVGPKNAPYYEKC